MAVTEFGHQTGRVYVDQDGQFHLNGAVIYVDESGTTVSAADLASIVDPATRIVNVPAATTSLALTAALHAERFVIVPIITGAGATLTLPAATGTGNKYTIINNGVQTVALTVTALAG